MRFEDCCIDVENARDVDDLVDAEVNEETFICDQTLAKIELYLIRNRLEKEKNDLISFLNQDPIVDISKRLRKVNIPPLPFFENFMLVSPDPAIACSIANHITSSEINSVIRILKPALHALSTKDYAQLTHLINALLPLQENHSLAPHALAFFIRKLATDGMINQTLQSFKEYYPRNTLAAGILALLLLKATGNVDCNMPQTQTDSSLGKRAQEPDSSINKRRRLNEGGLSKTGMFGHRRHQKKNSRPTVGQPSKQREYFTLCTL